MAGKNQKSRIGVFGAIALGVISYVLGVQSGENKIQKELGSKVIGERISIVDNRLGTAKLSDIDGDGDYDHLALYPPYQTGRHPRKPSDIYMKPGFLSGSLPEGIELHRIEGHTFDKFISRNKVPLPGSSLLNERTTGRHKLNLVGSYSGLFSPDFSE